MEPVSSGLAVRGDGDNVRVEAWSDRSSDERTSSPALQGASKAAVFCSGLFFGGAIDHAILALKGAERTRYGVRVGVAGNWLLGALDAVLALAAYGLHRRLA